MRFLEALLDALFPLTPRSERTRARVTHEIPCSPTAHSLLNERITTLMDYERQEVKDLIQSLKYDGSQHAASLAAIALADYLQAESASRALFSSKRQFVCAVPLHPNRSRERGFNQIEIVLRSLPASGGTTVLWNTLVRSKETSPQTRLSRSERLSNVAGAFALDAGAPDLADSIVYVIDDVTTTGATLVNAAQPLRRAGASVELIALARA